MKRCLIVDDDATTRGMLKALLEEFFECDLAEDGEGALCSFDMAHQMAAHYDLICLDITMRGMNGLNVLRHIRETELAVSLGPEYESTVIIISADHTTQTILNSFFACGASSYLTKPIGRDRLLNELQTLNLLP